MEISRHCFVIFKMAAGDSSSSWWSGWVNAAKETSLAALSATKRDLAEFVTVLKTDTEAAMTGATTSLRTLLVEEEEEEEKGEKGENPKPAFSTAVPMATSRFESQVYKMEVDPSTYTQPIEGAGHRKWAESFDVQEHTKEISDLLLSKPHLQQLHTQLVPTVVSYNDFWGRYFYHLHCIHEEVDRRASLVARATDTSGDCLNWDDDDEVPPQRSKADEDPQDVKPQTMSRNNSHPSPPPVGGTSDRSPSHTVSATDVEERAEGTNSKGESPPRAQLMITAAEESAADCPTPEVPPPPLSPLLGHVPSQDVQVITASTCREGQGEGSTKSDSNDSFVCIPGDQSPTPIPPLTVTESWQTINSADALAGWEVEPERTLKGSTFQSNCTSESDLVSVQDSEVGSTRDRSGSGQDKSGTPLSEDGGLQLEQLVREMERECGLEPTSNVKDDDADSLGDDWGSWDD